MTGDLSKPFYLSVKNHISDKCPSDKNEVIAGLNQAIEATKRRINEYQRENRAGVSELEIHLKNLQAWLEREKKREQVNDK